MERAGSRDREVGFSLFMESLNGRFELSFNGIFKLVLNRDLMERAKSRDREVGFQLKSG